MADEEDQKLLKVVEFYSGIGGMHYAIKACSIQTTVVAAIDINTTANEVYCHNFPNTALLNRNIEGINLNSFIKFNADVFMMSPPCQPFTRQGHQKASSDPRTKSFLYIMDVLRRLPKRPKYILMENVKGFETSDTRQEFVKTLEETNYSYQEFLLTPTQFGVPNSRLRYFLIAVQKPMSLPLQTTQSIMESLPNMSHEVSQRHCTQKRDNPRNYCKVCSETFSPILRDTAEKTHSPTSDRNTVSCYDNCFSYKSGDHFLNSSHNPLSTDQHSNHTSRHQDLPEKDIKRCEQIIQRDIRDFLDMDQKSCKDFLVPDNILRNKVLLMDIVQEGCNHSCCFTKGYGHYIEGTGSVFQATTGDSSSIFSQYEKVGEDDRCNLLKPLGLRYFTPREISNLHYFPKDFDFPETISTKQKYRLLGNSLNVLVVTKLAEVLFSSKITWK